MQQIFPDIVEENEFLQKSRHLTDYSLFVHMVHQERGAGKSLDEAIRSAIEQCIRQDIMREFLEAHGSEVFNMLLGEWKLDEAMEYKEQKGVQRGVQLGKEEMIRLFSDLLTPEQIAEKIQQPLEYVLAVLNGEMVIAEPEVTYNAEKKE